MPLNDDQNGEFDSGLEDEYVFDAHYPPGTEIGAGVDDFGEDDKDFGSADEQGPLDLRHDQGSGSYAEDGRLEVAEDRTMSNGESQVGSAAMFGPTEIGGDINFGRDSYFDSQYEIGAAEAADRPGSEIGFDDDWEERIALADARQEIGAAEAADRPGSEIGAGHYPQDGGSEIGRHADVMMPFEAFMLDETRMGAAEAADRPGSEIVGGAPAAVVKVIEKARDNRQPPPPMRAVDLEAPLPDDDWGLTDFMIGAANVTGNPDPFPLTSQLMLRAGATTEPRIVRVDTEASYKQFLVEQSPELSDLKARFEAHVSDPNAHGLSSDLDEGADLDEDIADLVHLGAEVEADQAAKRVEMWMPKRFDGLVTAWREGNFVCASMTLPGSDGEVRICTSLEPIVKCVEEMSRHAAESGVPAASVIGVLTDMGCVLGAGTVLKEMAAAAPAILARPEASMKMPFMVRIEPKVNPALGALMMLAAACRQGNQQACAEWQKLGELSAGPVKQAMGEAMQLAKAAGA